MQIPGDDSEGERAVGDLKSGRTRGAAAERQRDRDEEASSDTAV